MKIEELNSFLGWMAENKICSVIPFFVIQDGRDGKVPHWTDGKKLYNANELTLKYKAELTAKVLDNANQQKV